MYFIITIDTEADSQWDVSDRVTTENLKFTDRFQQLCNTYNFKPTYLCSYEIVDSEFFPNTIGKYIQSNIAEIGAHLHPWSNPPYIPDLATELKCHYYPTELPLDIFQQKMQNLLDLIEKKTGVKATSYRAGRWGFSSVHIPILQKMGIIVDGSVTPYVSWENHPGLKAKGPNFKSAPSHPYILDNTNVNKVGSSGLLEVPPTILFTQNIFNNSAKLRNILLKFSNLKIFQLMTKVINLNPVWLRPFPEMSAAKLKIVVDKAIQLKSDVIELMFHSSELMAGGSPYNKTSQDIDNLYARFEELFKYISDKGIKCVTMSEYAQIFMQEKKNR